MCIGGLGEVASGLAYAERFKKRLDPGSYKIKVPAASNGECKGDVVAKSPLTVAALDNLTSVVRSVDGTPGITTFGNDVSPTAPGEIRMTTAHMMKGGPIDVWSNGVVEIADLLRGDDESTTLPADAVHSVRGTKTGESAPVVGPRVIDSTSEGQAFSFVMVRTKVANSRFVVFKQSVVTPPA